MHSIRTIHIDSPPDKVVTQVFSTFSGWIGHDEITAQEINNVLFRLLFNGHSLPLRRTLYPRSDLDRRYGTGFTAYIDAQSMAEMSELASPPFVNIEACLDDEQIRSEPIAMQDSVLRSAVASSKNLLRKKEILKSLLSSPLDADERLPVNRMTGSMQSFETVVEAKADPVSAFAYDGSVLEFISGFDESAILLDIGCGLRSAHMSNIINCEIYDYPSTDILCSCDSLPFNDNSIDGVLSLAVLEHVEDPFASAEEILRILKPGGKVLLKIPFLQAEHGYPFHFFNATRQGARRLFSRAKLEKQWLDAADHPINTLHQVIDVYASGLDMNSKDKFYDLTLRDIYALADPRVSSKDKSSLLQFANMDVPWRIAWGTTSIFSKQ